MKIFLDTNIFPEFIDRRAQYNEVCLLIDAIHNGHFEACISTGCMYTLAFLFERSLKRLDVHRPELTKQLRGYLAEVLDLATVVDIPHSGVEMAVYNEAFSDIEDSFQYQCALENDCDALVTINIEDYKNADLSHIEILTPSAFADKYINV